MTVFNILNELKIQLYIIIASRKIRSVRWNNKYLALFSENKFCDITWINKCLSLRLMESFKQFRHAINLFKIEEVVHSKSSCVFELCTSSRQYLTSKMGDSWTRLLIHRTVAFQWVIQIWKEFHLLLFTCMNKVTESEIKQYLITTKV